MNAILRLPATRVWLLLMALTTLSYLLVENNVPAHVAATSAVIIAAVKVRLVFIHFMELGWNVRPWRLLYEGWTIIVTAILLGGYIITGL